MLLSERGEKSTLSAWAVQGGFGDAVSAGAIEGRRGCSSGEGHGVWGDGTRPRPRTSLPGVTAVLLESQW